MSPIIYSPQSAAEAADIVSQAAANASPLHILGGGSKRLIRAVAAGAAHLDMRSVSGITDYDADELVLTAGAGTALAEIEAALDERRQMLAFEPFDHGPLQGEAIGCATLGGIVAANVSGPRRVSAGAARDHMLGFSAVSGRGESLKGGAAVVKNVTGFDLPKLMAGSWGTLAVMTSVTMRVLPRPRTEKSVLFRGLSAQRANRLMIAAVSSPAAVSCAAHLTSNGGLTALRVEGFGPSVEVRCRDLQRDLAAFGAEGVVDAEQSAALWAEVRMVSALPAAGHALWRVSVPPALGWQVAVKLDHPAAEYLYDWGGALVWVTLPDGPGVDATDAAVADVYGVARALGGHAQLIRGSAALRAALATRLANSAAAGNGVESGNARAMRLLQSRVKSAFDPQGILNPGLDLAAL